MLHAWPDVPEPSSAVPRAVVAKRVGRVVLAGAGFAYVLLTALYLTLPDVRPLATANPETTAFIELRARQARAEGKRRKRAQRWVPTRASRRP